MPAQFVRNVILLVGMVGFVAGCGAVHSGLQPTPLGNPDLQTGHAKPTIIKDQKSGEEKYVNVPYTIAGYKESYQEVAEQVFSEQYDENLIKAFQSVEVQLMKVQENQFVRVADTPDMIKVILRIGVNSADKLLFYEIPLNTEAAKLLPTNKTDGNSWVSASASIKNPEALQETDFQGWKWNVTTECLEQSCKAIKLVFRRHSDDDKRLTLGLMYSEKQVRATFNYKEQSEKKFPTMLKPKSNMVLKRDYQVVNGPSYSEVWIEVNENRHMYFKTELTSTLLGANEIASVRLSNAQVPNMILTYLPQSIGSGQLIGNDAEEGDIWVHLTLNDYFFDEVMKVNERSIWVRDISVSTYNTETLPESPTTVTIPDENSEYFNISNGRAKEISRSMNFYKNSPNLRSNKWIERHKNIWLGNGDNTDTYAFEMCHKANGPRNRREDLQNYFTNIGPAKNELEQIYNSAQLPPHFSLLTIIESSGYAKKYKIEKSGNPKETALGPLQINNPTANDVHNFAQQVGLDASDITPAFTSSNPNNPSDSRNYFLPSNKMAAILIHRMDKVLNLSPGLLAMGYNAGPGVPQSIIEDATLEKIIKYGAQASCEYLDYAFKFLALKYIIDDYKLYGFDSKPRTFSTEIERVRTMRLQPL